MKLRNFWLQRIENAWEKRRIVWLSGVRRAGKTVLAQSLPNTEYFDCELAPSRFFFEDTLKALNKLKGKRVILDEVHKLPNPSELLKVAHDHFPEVRVLATGSSSLEISSKFKDTLTGRKIEAWLTPMNFADLNDFGSLDFKHRLLHGGLPQFFLSQSPPDYECEEWMDSFWSRDIQELFRIERRTAFLKLAELLFIQSGTIFEATRFAGPCEVNRSTITNYLAILEQTNVLHVIRPLSGRKSSEITSAPKTYAFDTGFVCYFRGWRELHPQECGALWEHLVLNELYSYFLQRQILYWRNKQGQEIDFVLAKRGKAPDAIECKWRTKDFDASNLHSFRRLYPEGRNFVVASDVTTPTTKQLKDIEVTFIGLADIANL
jgi:predicted AAA+ superfamily ATPase